MEWDITSAFFASITKQKLNNKISPFLNVQYFEHNTRDNKIGVVVIMS